MAMGGAAGARGGESAERARESGHQPSARASEMSPPRAPGQGPSRPDLGTRRKAGSYSFSILVARCRARAADMFEMSAA